jgi:Protein of unknown function (DUF1579)
MASERLPPGLEPDEEPWMQEPTRFHKQLSLLEGVFSGVETHHPFAGHPNTLHATARVIGRFSLNNLFLLRDYETRRDGQLLYQGHGVYGWDPSRQAHVLYWFDTSGTESLAPVYGTWSGDELVFPYQRADKTCRMRYRFSGTGGYDFSVDVREPDGTWRPTLSARYVREQP